MEAIWIFKRKFDCNLRVEHQNGIHAGPVETVYTWHDGAVPLPQLRSTMFGGIGLGLGLGLGLDFGLGLGIVTGAPFRDTCHTLALALALLAWPCLIE